MKGMTDGVGMRSDAVRQAAAFSGGGAEGFGVAGDTVMGVAVELHEQAAQLRYVT